MNFSLSEAQEKTLRDLAGEVYLILPQDEASPLLEGGYAIPTTIDPEPTDGIAVNITVLGRSYILLKDESSAESSNVETVSGGSKRKAGATSESDG